MRGSSTRKKIIGASVATALAFGCLATPCVAADDAARPAPATTRSLTKLSAASAALLMKTDQGTQPASPTQFFRTKKGAAVLALMGAGFGYALYSRFHDEIKSPIREQ